MIMFATIYGVGIGFGYIASRPMVLLTQRLMVFHGISHMSMVSALFWSFQ